MGRIIFSSKIEPDKAVFEFDITNWRALLSKTFKKGISIINENYDEILIPEATLDEINKINYCSQTVVKENASVIGCWLPCNFCSGSGLTDWVAKTMGVKRLTTVERFERDPHGYILSLEKFGDRLLYVSTPRKDFSREFCHMCHGSGLNAVKKRNVVKRFKIEFC